MVQHRYGYLKNRGRMELTSRTSGMGDLSSKKRGGKGQGNKSERVAGSLQFTKKKKKKKKKKKLACGSMVSEVTIGGGCLDPAARTRGAEIRRKGTGQSVS